MSIILLLLSKNCCDETVWSADTCLWRVGIYPTHLMPSTYSLMVWLLSYDCFRRIVSKFPSDSRRTIRALYVCLNIYFRRIRAIVCAILDNLPWNSCLLNCLSVVNIENFEMCLVIRSFRAEVPWATRFTCDYSQHSWNGLHFGFMYSSRIS